jgi:hypothetical protein
LNRRYREVLISYTRSIFLAFIAVYFLLIPAGMLIQDLRDPGLHNGQIPEFTYRWHGQLTEGFNAWATDRVKSGKASQLNTLDVSGTEWPMFSSVFYLWATESLQKNWERDQSVTSVMPKIYAEKAINAAVNLITDPDNAAWVVDYWGEDYLHQQNLFYRMLLIAGLTSYQKLTGDEQYQPLLLDQVNTLSREIDASPYGLVDDYPGQCYPVDILPAIAVIKRADEVLGSDHSKFVARSLRAFEGSRLDVETNLPAYIADSTSGQGIGPARGVGISLMLIWAPELWPETAKKWYKQYEQLFWTEGGGVSAFNEFSKKTKVDQFFFEVDAGPVIAGYGAAASAFGIGAARANNKAEQAYPLAAEALVASWPLPNGALLIPKLLSNFTEAPYLGETALLFAMTRENLFEGTEHKDFSLPYFVYLFLCFYIITGLACVITSINIVRKLHNS